MIDDVGPEAAAGRGFDVGEQPATVASTNAKNAIRTVVTGVTLGPDVQRMSRRTTDLRRWPAAQPAFADRANGAGATANE